MQNKQTNKFSFEIQIETLVSLSQEKIKNQINLTFEIN